MGLFSMYTGLIYNDIFAKSLKIFDSSWKVYNLTLDDIKQNKEFNLDPRDSMSYSGSPYPIGMDPAWQLAKNKIIFHNSFKMKISIILGIIHMLFGLMMGLFNHM